MSAPRNVLLALTFIALAPPVEAGDTTFSLGITATSDYVVYGASQTANGAAIQPYLQFSSGPFYAGIWLSNVSFGADTIETDLYVGLAGDFGGSSGLSYDLSYYRYYYNASGSAGGEVIGNLSWDTSLGLALGITGKNSLTGGPTTGIFSAEYEFANGFSVSAEAGKVATAGGAQFWNAGFGVPISDAVGMDIRMHDSDTTTPLYTIALSWDQDFNGLFR